MNAANFSSIDPKEFTMETLSQLAINDGFSIYRSSYIQITGAILICGEPNAFMIEKISSDNSSCYIILPDEDKAAALRLYFQKNHTENVHIYDCRPDELPFHYTAIRIAYINSSVDGLNSHFFSEMYTCLNMN